MKKLTLLLSLLSGPLSAQGISAAADTASLDLQLSRALATRPDAVNITADRADMARNGVSVFSGGVEVRRGSRRVVADEARYDSRTARLSVNGNVRYQDSGLTISGRLAAFDTTTDTGNFSDASFALADSSGRGSASRISSPGPDRLVLDDVRYTTCPVGDDDWLLIAPEIRLDRALGVGSGRRVRVEFQGLPILYTPYMSFPIDDTRKTGLLLPDIGTSDRSGLDLSLPYYLNLAPNYDLTLTPRWLSRRGIQLKNAFRYLLPNSKGDLLVEFMPSDNRAGRDRGQLKFVQQTRFATDWRLLTDITHVTDDNYFEDLGSTLSGASQTHTERRVDVDYRGDHWMMRARAQGFQTLDETILADDRPYERVPQLIARGHWDDAFLGLDAGFRSELVNFDRSTSTTGLRLDVEPYAGLNIGSRAASLRPQVSVRHTRYQLNNAAPDIDSDASRTAPVFSLDGQLTLQRETGRDGRLVQTLEPRIRYTHIPFRNQTALPVFDSGIPDFTLVQLFRDNRFTGADRLGDTDQLSIGVTTKFFASDTGRQYLNATVGQALFLSSRGVTLPDQARGTSAASTLIAQVELGLSQSWNADVEYQWNPDNRAIAKAALRFQYRPADDRVLNLGYRFRDSALEQTDVSFAWPLGDRWRFVGRWNYSLEEQETLERFVGLEYTRCCWSARLVSRTFVSNREGDRESGVFVQIELKGLTSVGARADEMLENGILGYSRD